MGTFVVVCTAVMLGAATLGGLGYYLLRQHRARHLAECKDFKTALVRAINSRSTKPFVMGSFVQQCGASEKVVHAVACELYAALWDKALSDGVMKEGDRDKIRRVASILDLSTEDQERVELQRKGAKYKQKVDEVLADGRITEAEQRELMQLRKNLGLTPEQSVLVSGRAARDGYQALFRKIIDDSVITREELEELKRFREAIGLSASDANRIVNADVMKLYKEWFYGVVNSGEINTDQERALTWLAQEFGLDEEQTRSYRDQIEELKEIARLRSGELPKVITGKLLESGEICHLEADCTYEWDTRTKTNQACGELLVTSSRVLFFSPSKNFSFSPSKIHDIEYRRGRVYLKTSTSKGTGTYISRSARRLAAILEGLVRRHNYLITEGFSTAYTRHIPPEVRREVWHRDNGRCVQCGATQYLEFDHIIPHSRGGANTVGNVQLLCRKCNNDKRDRI